MEEEGLNPTWWEKTVEYKFVAQLALANKLEFAAPLSGRHERTGGDAVIAYAEYFTLIEYKRDVYEIESERKIFYNYEEARVYFGETDHHLIICGHPHENRMTLVALPYFSTSRKCTTEVVELIGHGIPYSSFLAYLEELSFFKEPDGRGGGKGGAQHVSLDAMSTVLGVSASGTVVSTCALYEFAPQLFHEPTPTPNIQSSHSSAFEP